jgi:NTP pyrophosphatase (non-canonical NTP hydrolase)
MDMFKLSEKILFFRDERDWKQFHRPNHLAAAIAIEAAELQEKFLWKTPDQVAELNADPATLEAISDEIADVLIYSILLANELGVDPAAIIDSKLAKNAIKYPVHKARGSAIKYTDL